MLKKLLRAHVDRASFTSALTKIDGHSRELILRRAIDIASLESLDRLSFGRLAADVGVSKAGVQTLFPTKTALQLATVERARQMFAEFVSGPLRGTPHGIGRLQKLVERWLEYVERPVLQGGCFQVANLATFDSQPGPVRDRLAAVQREWCDLLAVEVTQAVENGEIRELDVELAVFQIDAVLRSANTWMRLGEPGSADRVRRTVEAVLHLTG